MPVLDIEHNVIAVAVTVNKQREGKCLGFSQEDERMMVGLCTQVGKAFSNFNRRPEEHTNLSDNLSTLRSHTHIPIRQVGPTKK